MVHGARKSRVPDIIFILTFGLLAVVGGNITSSIVLHWLIEGFSVGDLLVFFLGIAAAFFGAIIAWRRRESTRALLAKVEQLPARSAPRQALICFLSTQTGLKQAPAPSGPVTVDMGQGRTIELVRQHAGTDVQLLGQSIRWPWEQLLRGVEAHAETLKLLYIIGSSDSGPQPGSFRQLPIAAQFLAPYLRSAQIRSARTAVDFENYEDLNSALDLAIHEAQLLGIRDRDICIDITGGQKPTSAAGTIATLNRDVVLQYVQTGGQKQALIYDVRYEADPKVGA